MAVVKRNQLSYPSNEKKDLEIKNSQINAQEIRMKELEENHQAQMKKQEKKLKDLENVCKQKNRKEKISDDKDSETKIHTDTAIKCGKCEFQTTSRQGLKIHMARLNSNLNFDEFPAAFDICEKNLENATAKLRWL